VEFGPGVGALEGLGGSKRDKAEVDGDDRSSTSESWLGKDEGSSSGAVLFLLDRGSVVLGLCSIR
jgi:hypothetical protein